MSLQKFNNSLEKMRAELIEERSDLIEWFEEYSIYSSVSHNLRMNKLLERNTRRLNRFYIQQKKL